MSFKLTFSAIVLLLVVSSCKGRLEKHGELFADMMKNEDGLFRGVNIGDDPDQVQRAEGIAPSDFNQNVYSYDGTIGESGSYTIRYGFENGKVYEILVSATFDENTEGLNMLNGFRDYYNEVYGLYEKEGGYLVWKTKSNSGNPDVMIEMVDESEFSDFGQFSLSMYHQLPPAKQVPLNQ